MFKKLLIWFLIPTTKTKKNNIRLFLVCLCVSGLFWLFNSLNKHYTTTIYHPIVFDFDKTVLTNNTELPKNIRVSVTGQGWNILNQTNSLTQNITHIKVDTKHNKQKEIDTKLILAAVKNTLNGLKINEIVDSVVFAKFEKIESKKIHFQIDAKTLSIAKEYKMDGEIVINPAYIIVMGPKSLVDKVNSVILLPIKDKNIDYDYVHQFNFTEISSSYLKTNHSKVNVSFKIKRK